MAQLFTGAESALGVPHGCIRFTTHLEKRTSTTDAKGSTHSNRVGRVYGSMEQDGIEPFKSEIRHEDPVSHFVQGLQEGMHCHGAVRVGCEALRYLWGARIRIEKGDRSGQSGYRVCITNANEIKLQWPS